MLSKEAFVKPGVWRLVLCAACGLYAGAARAGTFEISPVIIDLTPGQTTAAIEVRNRGDKPVAVQARPYAWTQTGDQDPLTPADEVIISPPIFTVAAGETQVVRLLLRGGARARERDYRLLVDEVPTASEGAHSVTIKLEMSLPVFAPPILKGDAALTWRLQPRGADGKTLITVTNGGLRYARINLLELQKPDGGRISLSPAGATPLCAAGRDSALGDAEPDRRSQRAGSFERHDPER